MTRDEAITILREHTDSLRAHGVARLSLFGSTACDEARPASDVDVLVDIDPSRAFSLLDLSALRLFLCDLLGRDADVLIDRQDLRPALRAAIGEDAIQVFPEDRGAQVSAEERLRSRTLDETRARRTRLERRCLLDRLGPMKDAAAAIQEYIAGKTCETFCAERMVRSAVERDLAVISEASRHLPEALKARFPAIDWRGVAGICQTTRQTDPLTT